jgi:NodT family efflux transporter outer membrane factor (OMF) lipoprotein
MRIRPLLAAAATLLAGCAIGPEFRRPTAPATEHYTADAQPAATVAAAGEAGAAQRFVSGAELPGRWWESFQCDALNAVVADALTHSPSARQARARLREAQADLAAQNGATLYPSVDAQLGATREKVNPAALGFTNIPPVPAFNLYNVQVNVSYTLDLVGANRRMLEGARAQTEYQAYETEAAELTLAANVVAAAIRQADLATQVDYTQQIIAAESRQLTISEERYEAGGIALEDLDVQRSQLEQLRATLPMLAAQRREVDHLLAVYSGQPPAAVAIARFRLSDLHLPTEVPLTLPAELVRRRPDVRASEALWHEASANVGVATANLFPHLTVSGYAGSQRSQTSQLVDGTNVWSIGATLLQPIFHGGELRAKKRSAVAAYDAARGRLRGDGARVAAAGGRQPAGARGRRAGAQVTLARRRAIDCQPRHCATALRHRRHQRVLAARCRTTGPADRARSQPRRGAAVRRYGSSDARPQRAAVRTRRFTAPASRGSSWSPWPPKRRPLVRTQPPASA